MILGGSVLNRRYAFLDQFLVPNTKNSPRWFDSVPTITITEKFNGPSGIRTQDLRIMSPLL
jgi:hypothetical protein